MERSLIKEVLAGGKVGAKITVGGWVRTARPSKGGFAFIALNDGSCMGTLQIVADGKLANYESQIVRLTAGCSVVAEGELKASPAKGQTVELHADSVVLLGECDAEKYPIQPKQHSFEFLRTVAHLRPRTNTFGAVARVRNAISMAIHEFFQQRGFVYVHTPIVTASDCEGAGQLFRVTTLELDKLPRTSEGKIDFDQDFFARAAFLTVSGQLEGETYACAMGNIYTFGPTFRAENSNTPRHLSEFWMVEPEMAFCDLAGDADLAEAFLKHIFRTVLEKCKEDMAFFNERIDKTIIATLEHVATSDFVRLTYTDAVGILKKSGRQWTFPVEWGSDLQTEHERFLTEETFKKPVIITNYPAAIKSFYMRQDDPADGVPGPTVSAMDVLVPKIGEIIGGSQREERLDRIEQKIRGMNMRPEDYWWYLDLRRYGTVPHAGFGLGLERTVQFVTGMANIRDVIPFPRAPRSAEF
ncbi:MAG: asparagine--tRNA ligase [Planctomycetes bacterium]|nr:asparagine--tRNA ligase [Planctomycetota bacterium]